MPYLWHLHSEKRFPAAGMYRHRCRFGSIGMEKLEQVAIAILLDQRFALKVRNRANSDLIAP
jgi:hypothetical protein